MELLLVFWLLAILVATKIGMNKGRPVDGFVLGLLFGWIGVLLILVFSSRNPKCPHCGGEIVMRGATKCRHCGSTISGEQHA